MQISDLRIALTSGNYNYVRDGANRALNNLVGWLLDKGAAVRVYAPVVAEPAFPPTGDLVAVRSIPLPFRPEYQVPLGLGSAAGSWVFPEVAMRSAILRLSLCSQQA